jgi:hypothetical protein
LLVWRVAVDSLNAPTRQVLVCGAASWRHAARPDRAAFKFAFPILNFIHMNEVTLITADQTELSEITSDIARIAELETIGADTYDVVGPDAHPQTGNNGILQTVTFSVPANRTITHLTQDCIAGPCAWSYNPDGGYEISYRLSNGNTRAEWRRKHTSHPVTYRVLVHWTTV